VLGVDESKAYTTDLYGSFVIEEIDLATGGSGRIFAAPTRPLRLMPSADGASLFSTSDVGALMRTNLTTGETTFRLMPNGGSLYAMALAPGEPVLAVTASSGTLTLVSTTTMDTIKTATFASALRGVAYAATGASLYVAQSAGPMLRLNASTLAVEAQSAASGYSELLATADRRYVVGAGGLFGGIDVLDAQTLALLASVDFIRIRRMAAEPGSRTIWFPNDGPEIRSLTLR
jgi:hypothetical protein